MANGNHVSIIGNLTRDPELRFTPSGQATTSFGVAVNRRWQNRQTQEWDEQTSYFDVVCWGQLAENAAQSLGKGARVMVDGRLDQRSWENQEGERRSKIEITADEVAPSLRWATVAISKNERRTPDGGGYGGSNGGGSNGGGGNGGGSNGGGGNGSVPVGRAPSNESSSSSTYQYEEEPF
jgi:single-strand DNA-binding protein